MRWAFSIGRTMITLVAVGLSPELGAMQFIDAHGLPNFGAIRGAFRAEFKQELAITEGASSRPHQRLA